MTSPKIYIPQKQQGQTPQPPPASAPVTPPPMPEGGVWKGVLLAVGVALLVVVAAVGWQTLIPQSSPDELEQQKLAEAGLRPATPNLLLITADSIRKDHLGCYGGKKASTPMIDALARSGVLVENAVTVIPITLPSHACIMTGLYPPKHRVRDDGPHPLGPMFRTLAETLKDKGYATAAFVGSFLLDSRYGLDQGFETYDDDMTGGRTQPSALYPVPERPGEMVIDAATKWLEQHRAKDPTKPFFVWVHLFDAQSHFRPPKDATAETDVNVSSETDADDEQHTAYAARVEYVDRQVGRLKQFVTNQAGGAYTLIVFIGTHGESPSEHSEIGHGLTLSESVLAVPLIWHGPDVAGEARVLRDRLASTLDVAPTVLGLLQFESTVSFDGINILGDNYIVKRSLYIETLAPKLRHGYRSVAGVRRISDKLVLSETPDPIVFDLSSDPAESNDIHKFDSPRTTELLGAFQEYKSLFGGSFAAPFDPELFSDPVEELAEIGLALSPPVSPPTRPPTRLQVLEAAEQYHSSLHLLKIGQFSKVVAAVRPLLEHAPQGGLTWALLAKTSYLMGDVDSALQASLRAVYYQPQERHWALLARILLRKQEIEGFKIALEQLRRVDSNDGEIALLLAERAMLEEKFDVAQKHIEEVWRVDPARRSADAFALLGNLKVRQSDIEGAREAYESALDENADHVAALEGLADLANRSGNMTEEAEYLQQLTQLRPTTILYANRLTRLYIVMRRDEDAVAVMQEYRKNDPGDMAAVGNLGNIYMELGQLHKAIEIYEDVLRKAPEYMHARYNLADALEQTGNRAGAIEAYRKVIEQVPTQSKAYVRLIRLLSLDAKYSEAFDILRKAKEHNAVDWDALIHDEDITPFTGDPRFQILRDQAIE